MRSSRGAPRVTTIVLAISLALSLCATSSAYKIASEALSCGGAPSASATYRAHDTIGQGPVGPLAEGATTRGHDGFWLTLPSINVPVEGSFYAVLSDEDVVVLRWTLASFSEVVELNVYRATSEEGTYELVNEDQIELASTGSYEDASVWPDTEFWYELRATLADGSEDVVAGSPAMVKTGGKLLLALYPAYPNPFGDATTMRFDVPEHVGAVSVSIYNVRGQVVRRLVDGPLERGRYERTWNGCDDRGKPVAAGIYFTTLTVDGETERQKVMLLR
ncbi:MAG: T9SS type A sorting domain-containing protein [Candidatus Eisenbacteria bacterium]|nr:T9SS type A sorting domain-containing protein [Candidatus Eisenbacteria bacterium]